MKPITDPATLATLNRPQRQPISDPVTLGQLEYGIDFSQPVEAVRGEIAKLPAEKRDAALKTWADAFVANERKQGGFVQGASDVLTNVARGTPVGSWLDEAKAGISAARNATGLGGAPYDEALALERAKNRAIDNDSTKLGTLPVIGEVTAGGIQKLAGGIISAPFSPMARVVQGATLLPRMVNAAVTGTGYGAAYGAGEGEGAGDRIKQGAVGAGIGGALGAATPAVARGLSNAYGYAANRYQQMPPPLNGYHPQAVRNVAEAANEDQLFARNLQGQPRYDAVARELGPQGMLADMGPSLQLDTGRIANMPGRGRSIVTSRLEERREGAAGRIASDVNRALGQPVNVPASIEATRQAANQIARPLYDQFRATRIEPTNRLIEIIARVPDSVMSRARMMAAAEGTPLRSHRTRGYDGNEIDYIKRALDDMASTAERAGERSATRTWSNLARDLRNEVDGILSPNNPGQSVWAQARRASGEGLQFEEAAEMGRGAFAKSLTPEQMQADLAGLSPHQRQAYEIGARDQIRTAMGNASTAFGPNGDTAARRMLQTDFARDKLQMVARPGTADELNRRLRAETQFAETEQEALRNSATERRRAASARWPTSADNAQTVTQTTLPGIAIDGARRIANALTGGAINERRERIATDGAMMLTWQGVRRDQLAAALMQVARGQRLTQQRRDAIERIAENLMSGTRPRLVDEATTAISPPAR